MFDFYILIYIIKSIVVITRVMAHCIVFIFHEYIYSMEEHIFKKKLSMADRGQIFLKKIYWITSTQS